MAKLCIFAFLLAGYITCSHAVEPRASELLSCRHSSGAMVYTKDPLVLGPGFKCIDADREEALSRDRTGGISSKSRNQRIEPQSGQFLDPTPAPVKPDESCPSTVTFKINSTGYSGSFDVELRRGTRPGSRRLNGATGQNGGSVSFPNVCPGNYFIAFGPTASADISVTRSFEVQNDGFQYSMPQITVYFSQVNSTNSDQRVQRTPKSAL